MNKNVIIEMLKNEGFEFDTVNKNGQMYTRYFKRAENGVLTPAVYLESALADVATCEGDDNGIVKYLIHSYEEYVKNVPAVDVNKIGDKDYVLENVRLDLSKVPLEDGIVSEKWNGLFRYMRVWLTNNESYALRVQMLEMFNMTAEEMFEVASVNTIEYAEIQDLQEIYTELTFGVGFGKGSELLMTKSDIVPGEYVVTNHSKIKGAGILAANHFGEVIRTKFGKDAVILPSSIHEVIVIAPMGNESVDIDVAREQVCQVNATSLSLEERVSDDVYVINEYDNIVVA